MTISETGYTARNAALELHNAIRSYEESKNDIFARLARAEQDVRSAGRYSDGHAGREAGDIITAVRELSSNMRFDLLVKYAAEIETSKAVLKALKPLLSEEELALVAQIESL